MILNKIKINDTDTITPGVVYDISKATGQSYETLSDALSENNVPLEIREGGMSVRFVHTGENKYVQFRLMKNTWSTTEVDWQGVDDEPTVNSSNLVKSSGVEKRLKWLDIKVLPIFPTWKIIDVCQECDLGDGTTGQAVKLSSRVNDIFRFHRASGSRESVTITNPNQRIFPITDDISITSEVVLYYDSSDQQVKLANWGNIPQSTLGCIIVSFRFGSATISKESLKDSTQFITVNGEFPSNFFFSIDGHITQQLGNSETLLMSQNAIKKLNIEVLPICATWQHINFVSNYEISEGVYKNVIMLSGNIDSLFRLTYRNGVKIDLTPNNVNTRVFELPDDITNEICLYWDLTDNLVKVGTWTSYNENIFGIKILSARFNSSNSMDVGTLADSSFPIKVNGKVKENFYMPRLYSYIPRFLSGWYTSTLTYLELNSVMTIIPLPYNVDAQNNNSRTLKIKITGAHDTIVVFASEIETSKTKNRKVWGGTQEFVSSEGVTLTGTSRIIISGNAETSVEVPTDANFVIIGTHYIESSVIQNVVSDNFGNDVGSVGDANYNYFPYYYDARIPVYVMCNNQVIFGHYEEEQEKPRCVLPQLAFNGRFYHFSVDDVLIWKELINNPSGDLFDDTIHGSWKVYKDLHDQTGCVITLNLFSCDATVGNENDGTKYLADIPDVFKSQFEACKDWLRLSHHSYFTDQKYAESIANHSLLQDYTYFIQQVTRFAGANSIDTHIRLGYFSCGTETEAMSIKNIAYGVTLYSTADDTRVSNMYLDADERSMINIYGTMYDQKNKMFLVRSMPRLDDASGITNAIENLREHHLSRKAVEYFCHGVSSNRLQSFVDLFNELNSMGYKSIFFSDLF